MTNVVRFIIWIEIICTLLLLFSAFRKNSMIRYYSGEDNYVEASGTVSYMKFNEEEQALYLSFTNLSPSFSDHTFKIVGENYRTVCQNGISGKVHPGNRVSFISAPWYIGDGYVMPIVEISTAREELLSFEEGMDNYLAWLDEQ